MKSYLIAVVYRSEINKHPINGRDIQVIFMRARSKKAAVDKVIKIKIHKYKNINGESVSWPLVDIMSIVEMPKRLESGELIGFIANKAELFGKISLNTPTKKDILKRFKSV